jgi:hypothetical protein
MGNKSKLYGNIAFAFLFASIVVIAVANYFFNHPFRTKSMDSQDEAMYIPLSEPISTPISAPISSPLSLPVSTPDDSSSVPTILEDFAIPRVSRAQEPGWLVYEHPGFPYYEILEGFKLYFPETWNIVERRNDDASFLEVTLSKGNSDITIAQWEGGIGNCLYHEDPPEESMAERYGAYETLTTYKDQLPWRIAQYEDTTVDQHYIVCEYRPEGSVFNGFTSIGSIQIEKSPDNDVTWAEIDQILEKIEVVPVMR